MRYWIQTFSGVAFDLENPMPGMIVPEDIAHALARLCRYTGHSIAHYSVAQHCVHVSERVPANLAFVGLMHDAAEAYIGDVASPLKRLIGEPYKAIEGRVEAAIRERFGIAETMPPAVKEADMRMLATERLFLLGPEPRPWNLICEPYARPEEAPWSDLRWPWPADFAETRWLARFRELGGRI